MELKDQLVADIKAARLTAKRNRRSALPNDEWWKEIKETEIAPVLSRAVLALKETQIESEQESKNGGSGISLLAGNSEPRQHHLTFIHEAGKIKVSSSESDVNDKWDRKHTTPEEIISKVRDFVRQVATRNPEHSKDTGSDHYAERGVIVLDEDS